MSEVTCTWATARCCAEQEWVQHRQIHPIKTHIISKIIHFFSFDFGWRQWRQAEAWILFLVGAFEVNALAQGALRRFIQWPWVEHPTYQFGGHSATELSPPLMKRSKAWLAVLTAMKTVNGKIWPENRHFLAEKHTLRKSLKWSQFKPEKKKPRHNLHQIRAKMSEKQHSKAPFI